MPSNLPKEKHIPAVDGEPDVLDILDEELQGHEVISDRVARHEKAVQRMASLT